MPSVLGHIHYFHKQVAGHRLWVCSGRNYCRKHSESQPNLRTSFYTMDNLQIKETLFTCWLFFQLSSQYICCAIAVLGSWEKTSYINKQDYFLSKRAFRKGALSASDGVQLFLPTPGPCRIILIPKVTEKEISEILYSKTLRSPLNSECSGSGRFCKMGKLCPYCISFQDTFVFKRGQPASPSHRGHRSACQLYQGKTQNTDCELHCSGVLTEPQKGSS